MNPDVLILSVRSKDKPPLGFCRSAVYVGVVLGLGRRQRPRPSGTGRG